MFTRLAGTSCTQRHQPQLAAPRIIQGLGRLLVPQPVGPTTSLAGSSISLVGRSDVLHTVRARFVTYNLASSRLFDMGPRQP